MQTRKCSTKTQNPKSAKLKDELSPIKNDLVIKLGAKHIITEMVFGDESPCLDNTFDGVSMAGAFEESDEAKKVPDDE